MEAATAVQAGGVGGAGSNAGDGEPEQLLWGSLDPEGVCGANVGYCSGDDSSLSSEEEVGDLPELFEGLRPEDSVSNKCLASPPRSPAKPWLKIERSVSLPVHRCAGPPSPLLRRTISDPSECLPPFPLNLKTSRMQHNARLIEAMEKELEEGERDDSFSAASTMGVRRGSSVEHTDYCPLLL